MSSNRATVDLEVVDLALTAGGAPGARRLFEALSFRVAAGDRWVVIGPNGSGKSSLLAALAGIFPLAAGDLRFDGRPVANWRPEVLAERRAWSPQFWFDPFPASVAETAVLARERGSRWLVGGDAHADPQVQAALGQLDLLRLADHDVQSLSGGERQRVTIATAMLQGAPLLLLDEPASHLDPSHQRLLLDVLSRHASGGGAFVASLHDLNLAWDLASHAIVLDGRGGAVAGLRDHVLTAGHLGRVFAVEIEAVEVRGARRFVIGPGAPARGG